MKLKIIWGDIVGEKTDALVTLASKDRKVGSGVDKSVHAAAGAELLPARLAKAAQMGPGIAVFTQSFGLKKTCGAKNVIHIAGVLWEGGGHDEQILLDAAYLKALAIANALKAKTVSLPVMGAGKYGMPKPLALDQAVKSLTECLKYFPDIEIKLLTVEAEIYDYAKSKYSALCESHFSAEEEAEFRKRFPAPRRAAVADYGMPWSLSKGGTEYWRNCGLRQFERIGDFTATLKTVWRAVRERDSKLMDDLYKEYPEEVAKKRIDVIEQVAEGECGHFPIYNRSVLAGQTGIKERKLKNILDGTTPCPSRDVVMALCVSLGLPTEYASVMMRKCGYMFVCKEEEAAYSDCIRTGNNSVNELNEVLRKRLGRGAAVKPECRKPPMHHPPRKRGCKPKKSSCTHGRG